MSRPAIHFTPERGWMNDPNGLVSHEGLWHLFFQHNPDAETWGPMHWGHAVSEDLVRWTPWPVALAPDEHGSIFSGSVVIDADGVAGFGHGAMVAVFTYDGRDGQSQALAGSCDGGRTWAKHPANPILRGPDGMSEFRDPRVLRWASPRDPGGGHWVMALACGSELRLYVSRDLVSWAHASSLARASEQGILETPDLFPIATEDGELHWVLSYGVLDRRPGGRSGTRYLVGAFDGSAFRPYVDAPEWADEGPDFYAAQTWTGAAAQTWVAWLGNWAYALEFPSMGWRGTMSIPRELSLVRSGGTLRLRQAPAASLAAHGRDIVKIADTVLEPGRPIVTDGPGAIDLGLRSSREPTGSLTLDILDGDRSVASLVVRSGAQGLEACLTRQPGDFRSATMNADWVSPAKIALEASAVLELRVLVDATSIEVFANGTTASAVLPPAVGPRRVRIESHGAPWPVDRLECRVVASAAEVPSA